MKELLDIQKRYGRIDKDSRNDLLEKQSFNIFLFSEEPIDKLINGIYPWELNNLFTLSLFTENWKSDKYTYADLSRDVNNLRKSFDFRLNENAQRWILIYLSTQQFSYQINRFILMYRCNYYFNYIDSSFNLKELFLKKYNCEYFEFCKFLTIYSLLSETQPDLNKNNKELIKIINNEFSKVVSQLTISLQELKDDYNNLQINITKGTNNYSVLIQKPIVTEDKEVLITSYHNFVQACTTSLIYRMTLNNKELRESIGKKVKESYLFHITSTNPVFTKVVNEKEYEKGKLTPDVMATDGKTIILIKSKSYSPKIRLRDFDDEVYEEQINKIVKYVSQIYEHCRYYFGNKYNYLDIDIDEGRNNIYGLVVVEENPYFDYREVYKRVSDKVGIKDNELEYDWLTKHIGVVDTYAYERFVLSKRINFSTLSKRDRYDVWLNNIKIDGKKHDSVDGFSNFYNRLLNDSMDTIKKIFHN